MRCLLEGDPRRILAAPVGKRCTGRLAVLEPRDVMAGIAGEFVDGLLAHVPQQGAVAVGTIEPDEHPLVSLDRVDVGEPLGEHLLGPHGRESFLEINQCQFVERLPFFRPQFAGGRHRERRLA